MTNRAEIQAGMVDYIRLVGNNPEVYTPEMCSEDLMEYLHSQGVVIKGEHICGQCIRGLADSIHSGASTVCPACHGNYRTLAVEPLIDEDYFTNERFERG